MRWLRWWYFVILFALIMGGLGYWGYNKQIVPAIAAREAAVKKLQAAVNDAHSAEKDYKGTYIARAASAEKFVKGYMTFHALQDTMPNVDCMSEVYADDKTTGLLKLYQLWGSGQIIHELNNWVKPFHLEHSPSFSVKGTLGYEPTLTSPTIVHVPLTPTADASATATATATATTPATGKPGQPAQPTPPTPATPPGGKPGQTGQPDQASAGKLTEKFVGHGLADLCRQITIRTGYAHYPMIITCAGTTIAAPAAAATTPSTPTPAAAPTTPPAPATPAKKGSIEAGYFSRPAQSGGWNGQQIAAGGAPPAAAPPAGAPPAGAPPAGAPPAGAAAGGAKGTPAGAPPAGGAPAGGAASAAPAAPAAAAGGGDCGPITIKLVTKDSKGRPVRYDPKNPLLEMDYTAESYFMTHGWDPYGKAKDAKAKFAEALKVMEDKDKKPEKFPGLKDTNPPALFWFFKMPVPSI